MGFFKRNLRLFIIIITFIVSFSSFFSVYFTSSYKHLKQLESELSQARLQKELILTETVVGLNETPAEDPMQKFKQEKNVSNQTIKEIDTKIKGSQVIFTNSFITVLSQLKLGLDLVGGAQLTFQALTGPDVKEVNKDVIAGLIKVFENRVNASGTTEAIVQQVGKDRILVEIPGADPEIVKRRLLKTALDRKSTRLNSSH